MNKSLLAVAGLLSSALLNLTADIILIGNNLPHESKNDGDFSAMTANWRKPEKSPYWNHRFEGGYKAGFAEKMMTGGGCKEARFESVDLTKHSTYTTLRQGDTLVWQFASKAQYPCNPRVRFSLLFGEQERVLVKEQPVPAGNIEFKTFQGQYTLTAQDVAGKSLKAHFTLFEDHGINVYVDYLDLKILRDETAGPRQLQATPVDNGIKLTWPKSSGNDTYHIYRSNNKRTDFKRLAESIPTNSWTDTTVINGTTNYYFVTRAQNPESSASPVIGAKKIDHTPPPAPTNLTAAGQEFQVHLKWDNTARDIAFYRIYRNKPHSRELELIEPHVTKNTYTDNLPHKGSENHYAIQAIDHSGNASTISQQTSARVTAVPGSSFSDLILPMPIHKELRHDLWGAETVLPRSADNGIEDPDWSYWGGKVIQDPGDGKFHLNVVRWPESARKGHWAWPDSTVAYATAEQPTGPYTIKRNLAYDYKNGLGHNTNIIPLNDGRYAMYSLIQFVPTIFTSPHISGPWKFEGVMKINFDTPLVEPGNEYLYQNNLTGIHCSDGSFLFLSKRGASMRSTNGILGPYEVLTKEVIHNPTIPKHLIQGCEDPAFWYDGVQYHMLINFHMARRAMYLRSPDGVNWKYETGLAFTPLSTVYEDGTRTLWYKLERPNVLQDEYGRATHLSLAALDVVKREDFGNDNHSSKHLILPLNVYKRIEILNSDPVTTSTRTIKILIHSEENFDPRNDLVLSSLRLGASEVLNYGGGCTAKQSSPHKDGLIIEFDAKGNGLTDQNFAAKLIGRSTSGDLVVGYTKLPSN